MHTWILILDTKKNYSLYRKQAHLLYILNYLKKNNLYWAAKLWYFSLQSCWQNGLRLSRCKLMSCLYQSPQIFRKCIYFPFELNSCLLLLSYYQLFTKATSSQWIHSKAGEVISNYCTNSQSLHKARIGCLDPRPRTDWLPHGLLHPGERHLPAFSLLPTPQHCQERLMKGREAQGTLCNCEILEKL